MRDAMRGMPSMVTRHESGRRALPYRLAVDIDEAKAEVSCFQEIEVFADDVQKVLAAA